MSRLRVFSVGIFTLFIILPSVVSVCEEKQTSTEIKLQITKIEDIGELIKPPPNGMTIINLWATWCPPCVKELPHFIEFYKKHGNKNVKLVLLSVEGKEAEEKVLKPFLSKNPIPFQVYLLEKGTPEEIEKVLNVKLSGALPVTIIYDNDGKILKKFDGPITLDDLELATNLKS